MAFAKERFRAGIGQKVSSLKNKLGKQRRAKKKNRRISRIVFFVWEYWKEIDRAGMWQWNMNYRPCTPAQRPATAARTYRGAPRRVARAPSLAPYNFVLNKMMQHVFPQFCCPSKGVLFSQFWRKSSMGFFLYWVLNLRNFWKRAEVIQFFLVLLNFLQTPSFVYAFRYVWPIKWPTYKFFRKEEM